MITIKQLTSRGHYSSKIRKKDEEHVNCRERSKGRYERDYSQEEEKNQYQGNPRVVPSKYFCMGGGERKESQVGEGLRSPKKRGGQSGANL